MFNKDFTKIYITLLLTHIAFLQVAEHTLLIGITKGLLLFSLMAYFYSETKPLTGINASFFTGLLFSFFGDIFMFLEDGIYFILGLVAFLIAHLFYIYSFYNQGKTFIKKNPIFIVPVLLYVISFLIFSWSYLGDLKIPVLVYALVLGGMVLASINRYGAVNQKAFTTGIMGAILFVISDSALAINKFMIPFEYAGILIMATYGMAQYFLLKAFMTSNEDN